MPAPRKYSPELNERAVRMAVEARQDPAARPGAITRVATQLGIHPEALRNYVRQAEIDGGVRPGTTAEGDHRDGSHVLCRTVRRVRCPVMLLQHRHGYASGFHHGLSPGDIDRDRSSPPRRMGCKGSPGSGVSHQSLTGRATGCANTTSSGVLSYLVAKV